MSSSTAIPVPAASPGRPARPRGRVFDIYPLWRSITYYSALVAFGGLFVTGEIKPFVGLAFFAGWLAGYFISGAPSWWRTWHESILTIIVIVALAATTRGAFFQSVLNLLLFLVLAKCWTLKTPRDHLQTQILCFFVLLSTSVMTVAFYFVIFFTAYLYLGAMGLLLFSLSRNAPGPKEQAERTERLLPGRLLAAGAWLTVLAALLLSLLFVFIPHLSVQRLDAPLSGRETPQENLTGFGEEVDFGQFKSLKPDVRVVMRVELRWPVGSKSPHPGQLRMRGMPLEYYDERRWRRSPSLPRVSLAEEQRISPRSISVQRGSNVYPRVYQNTDVTKRIFTAPLVTEIDLERDLRVRYDAQGIAAMVISFGNSRENTYTNPFTYSMTSNLVDEVTPLLPSLIAAQKKRRAEYENALLARGGRSKPVEPRSDDPGTTPTLAGADAWTTDTARLEIQSLVGAPGDVPWLLHGKALRLSEAEQTINLQLPRSRLTEKIRTLARRIAPGPSHAEIVVQSTAYLRQNFNYTLIPETPAGVHPIDAFLFQTQKGHCEYFATSLVLLLRSRGVPARLVNGFYTTEWNNLAELFVVKQSDAHTWVEVWLDGPGWLTVDPTPPGLAGRAAYGFSQPGIAEIFAEYLRIQWQRYVIDYSSTKQIAVLKTMKSLPGFRVVFEAAQVVDAWVRPHMAPRNLESKAIVQDDETSASRKVLGVGMILIVGLAGSEVFRRRRNARRAARGSGVDYWDLLLGRMEKLGRPRPPQQTPAEYIQSLEASGWKGLGLDWLLELYHGQRYAGVPASGDDRRRALKIVHDLRAPRAS